MGAFEQILYQKSGMCVLLELEPIMWFSVSSWSEVEREFSTDRNGNFENHTGLYGSYGLPRMKERFIHYIYVNHKVHYKSTYM